MSIEPSLKYNESPSIPIPTIISSVPSTPSTIMVVVPMVPIITPIHPTVSTQPIVTNPFGSIFGTPGYNTKSIPIASSPFSYVMPNFTSQFSYSIPTSNLNTSIRHGGMDPPHIPFSFGSAHIPQKSPTVGILPPFHPGSNPGLNALGWSGQPSRQVVSYCSSFTPTSSMLILPNTFVMMNPPLSSIFTPRGGQFHTLGNPQPRVTPVGGNI
jgi:hypothetical protein